MAGMRLSVARVGGALMLAGAIACLVAAALALGGVAVGSGVQGPGGVVFDLSLVLALLAAILLAVTGEGPLASRTVRTGLAIMALGAGGLLASAITIRLALDAYLPFFLQLFFGIPITLLGWLVLGIGLLRRPAPARLVGRMLVGGLALLPVLVLIANLGSGNLRFGAVTTPFAALAAALILAAIGGVGYLALTDRWSWLQAEGEGAG
jgi:hypothetical protein